MNLQQRRTDSTPRVSLTPRSFLAVSLAFSCAISFCVEPASFAAARDKKPKRDPVLKGLPITQLSTDEAIVHALNRLAYGPRPGDVEHVRQMGLEKWIEQQLNPGSINDKALEARLANYPTLTMSASRLQEMYPQPKQAEKQAANLGQADGKDRTQSPRRLQMICSAGKGKQRKLTRQLPMGAPIRQAMPMPPRR